MDTKRDYERCNITGTGILYLNEAEKAKFNIIDLSAIGMKAKSDLKLEVGSSINIEFYLNSDFFQKQIKTSVKVLNEYDNGNNIYGLKFVGLDELSKIEIDEVLKKKCDVSKFHNTRSCEDGHCVFFNSKK